MYIRSLGICDTYTCKINIEINIDKIEIKGDYRRRLVLNI